jgi:hypothetical protein
VTVNIDPDVAIGYEYELGAGDPLFKTVELPVAIGDGKYDIYVLESGVWTLLAGDVLGGDVFAFDGGVTKGTAPRLW